MNEETLTKDILPAAKFSIVDDGIANVLVLEHVLAHRRLLKCHN